MNLRIALPCFCLHKQAVQNVVDCPVYTQWSNFLLDILSENYQHREPLRVRMLKPDATHVAHGSLDMVQGVTRISIVYYCLKHIITFYNTNGHEIGETEMELLRGRA